MITCNNDVCRTHTPSASTLMSSSRIATVVTHAGSACLSFHTHTHTHRKHLTAEGSSNPAEMLQEKVSAATDGCVSRVQAGVQADLLSEEPQLNLSTAPTISGASEPDQVRKRSRFLLQ